MSKHAVVGSVRSLARPLEAEGIQINGICPSVIGSLILIEVISRRLLTHKAETGLADKNLFSSMILTPVSTAVGAVEEFVRNRELSGICAEISGDKFTFRPPPEYVDEATGKNIETFWRLGYA
jgi:NAD(P)-dependent dehydrogenase (short-subunit alcohol dehydrogenase family)